MKAHKILAVSLLLPFLLTGCGKKTEEKAMEKQIEQATGGKADVDLSKDRMSITTKTDKGEVKMQVGENVALPDNFPKDVFVYPGSKISTAMQTPEGFHVDMVSGDKKQDVIDAYQKTMQSNGWSVQTTMAMGPQNMMVYDKGDRTANIIISADDDNSVHITLSVGNK